ncbi:Hypothetical predicted protein, partial [Olea europaea subsp. europaea]
KKRRSHPLAVIIVSREEATKPRSCNSAGDGVVRNSGSTSDAVPQRLRYHVAREEKLLQRDTK